jgi:membrane dipeptidase
VSRAPVMASHSSCRALSSMPRNLTDGQIRRIAAKGGVVMINFGSAFLDQKIWEDFQAVQKKILPQWLEIKRKHGKDLDGAMKELSELFKAQGKAPQAAYTKVVDHIEHVIQVAGVDAVGLGTDFDGIPDPPLGVEDYSKLTKITEELIKRGHSDADIKKILGENFLAFLGRVEAAKKSLAGEKPSVAVYKPEPETAPAKATPANGKKESK